MMDRVATKKKKKKINNNSVSIYGAQLTSFNHFEIIEMSCNT